jgi:hypothetical protein
MQKPPSNVSKSYQRQMDASRDIAETIFHGTDRIEHLMIETTRKAFDEQMKFFQALATVRDTKSIAAVQSAFFSATPEKMTAAQLELIKIVTDAQKQITSTMDRYRASLGVDTMSASATSDVKSALNQPYNSISSINPLASVFSMWEKAFKESFELANRNYGSALAHRNDPAGPTAPVAARASAASKKGKRA